MRSLDFLFTFLSFEKKFSELEQNNKNLDNTTRNLGSRVFTLELRDLPYKIDEVVRENVKEAVQIALQAPLRDRFRDLPKDDIKEMLHHKMFETGSSQPPTSQSSAWKTSNTRDVPLSTSKQQSGPHLEQPVEDIPMQGTINISDSEDTGFSHLPKNTPRLEWLKPIPEEDRPATPEPAWVIPTSHIPDVFQMEECHKMLTDQIDWTNPEADQVRIDINKPLPLSGPP
ncbi:hypothetical protein Tco_1290185, partial [Tanacetum coccineum]